jgi:hypothetical protein
MGECCPSHTEQSVFAGAARADNENKHTEPH